MTNQTKNKPEETIRDGSLKAVIWKNSSEKGTRFSVELVRGYKVADGNWKDTHYLSNGEILKGSRLLEKAYDRIGELRLEDKANAITES